MLLHVFAYSFALWLGLYLIGRDPRKPRLLFTGLGLGAYALALVMDVLAAADPFNTNFLVAHRALLVLPVMCWAVATASLLPDDVFIPRRIWYATLALITVGYLLSVAGGLIFDFDTQPPQFGATYMVFALLMLCVLLVEVGLVWRTFLAAQPRRRLGLVLTATLFFGLSAGLLILPFEPLPPEWLVALVGIDLLFLGGAIAALDAFDEGEALLPDALRSLLLSGAAAQVFGGMVALVMSQSNRVSLGMWALLFASIGAAIGFQVFADALQGLFDRLVLRPQVRKERADLRAAASTLARIDPTPSPLALDEAEFNRLTRRALSHLGDLPRLAASPLAHLPIIEQRLAGRGAAVDTLARAAELKALLSESIARLKPPGNNEFGITQEWRHYNALYFPYVLGLKPYSQGFYGAELPLHAQDALDWFRANVPERTLYNWQNAAAKLVAQQLREQCETEMA